MTLKRGWPYDVMDKGAERFAMYHTQSNFHILCFLISLQSEVRQDQVDRGLRGRGAETSCYLQRS